MFRLDHDQLEEHEVHVQRNRLETVGPIVVVLVLFFAQRILFLASGLPQATGIAFVTTVVFVVAWIVMRRRMRRIKMAKTQLLRKELGELEKQEHALRAEVARQTGQFDRWEVKE